jgi:hypothetical protein
VAWVVPLLPEVTKEDCVLWFEVEVLLDVVADEPLVEDPFVATVLDEAVSLPATTIAPVAAREATTAPPTSAARTRRTLRVLRARSLPGVGEPWLFVLISMSPLLGCVFQMEAPERPCAGPSAG